MTEREVVLKLSAKAEGAESVRAQAQAVRELAEAEKSYRLETEKPSQRTQRQDAAAASHSMPETMEIKRARHERELTRGLTERQKQHEREYQEVLEKTVKTLERQKRLKHDLAAAGAGKASMGAKVEAFGNRLVGSSPLAPLFNPATAALTAFTLAIKGAQTATENYYRSLEYNPRTGRAEPNPVTAQQGFRHFLAENSITSFFGLFREQTRRTGTDTSRAAYERYVTREQNRGPIRRWLDDFLGNTAPGVTTPTMSYEQFRLAGMPEIEREHRLFLAHQARQFAPREASAYSASIAGTNRLERERVQNEAEARATLGLRSDLHAITQGAGTARRAVIGAVAKNSLYARETQIEDVNREIAMRQALAQATAQGEARQQSIRAQLGTAQQQEQQHRGLYEAAGKSETSVLASVQEAKDKQLGSQEIERREQYALAAAERRKQAENDLLQAQERVLELRKQGEQALLQTQEQQHAVLRSNLETVQKQVEMEKRGRLNATEALGLLHPMEQRTIRGLARKAQQGLPLTQAELAKMSQHRDIFGNVLQKEGMRRGTPLMDELRRMPVLGLDNRMQELQKAEIAIKNKIEATVKLDAGSVADALVKVLRPEILQLQAQFSVQLKNELDRMKLEMQAQRRAAFPSFGS